MGTEWPCHLLGIKYQRDQGKVLRALELAGMMKDPFAGLEAVWIYFQGQ